MKKSTILFMSAISICPTTIGASVPNSVMDNDDVPLIIHAPHRAPRHVPLVQVGFDEESKKVEITFNQSLANVSVLVTNNGASMMECFLGDIFAGQGFEVCLDTEENTEGMMLYIVSNDTIIFVNSLD